MILAKGREAILRGEPRHRPPTNHPAIIVKESVKLKRKNLKRMIASSWTNSHMIGLSLILQRRAKLLKSVLSCNSCRSELELISFVKRQLAPSEWHSRCRRLFWPRKEESCRRQHWVVYEWLFQMMMKDGFIRPPLRGLHTLSQTSWSAGRLAELSPLC